MTSRPSTTGGTRFYMPAHVSTYVAEYCGNNVITAHFKSLVQETEVAVPVQQVAAELNGFFCMNLSMPENPAVRDRWLLVLVVA